MTLPYPSRDGGIFQLHRLTEPDLPNYILERISLFECLKATVNYGMTVKAPNVSDGLFQHPR